jgi:hypothetical protein
MNFSFHATKPIFHRTAAVGDEPHERTGHRHRRPVAIRMPPLDLGVVLSGSGYTIRALQQNN